MPRTAGLRSTATVGSWRAGATEKRRSDLRVAVIESPSIAIRARRPRLGKIIICERTVHTRINLLKIITTFAFLMLYERSKWTHLSVAPMSPASPLDGCALSFLSFPAQSTILPATRARQIESNFCCLAYVRTDTTSWLPP